MPAARWTLFANQLFVPYDAEIGQLIAESARELEGIYIAKRWKTARTHLSLEALPVHLVIWLSRNAVGSITETIKMWSGVTLEMFSQCEGAETELARACARANSEQTTFPAEYLSVILHRITDGSLSHEHRLEMLIQALRMGCRWGDIVPILPLIGEEYGGLVTKQRVNLSTSESDRRLVEALKQRSFIGTVRPGAKHLVVYSKRRQSL
ncbi:hypothetical protein D3C79_736290 [compost metagenome]